MREPLITISRPAWKELVALAVGSTVETGGILVGRETRGQNRKVLYLSEMECSGATKSWLSYTEVQRASAVQAAEDRWPELRYLGEWHSHRYDEECILTHLPAISEHDAAAMLVGKVEVIAVVFPGKEKKLKNRWDTIWVASGEMRCSVEAWVRTKKSVIPCRIKVR